MLRMTRYSVTLLKSGAAKTVSLTETETSPEMSVSKSSVTFPEVRLFDETA